MVYTSIPPFLDPPEWNQQQQEGHSHQHLHQPAGANGGVVGGSRRGVGVEYHQQIPLQQMPPHPETSTVATATRPMSMADRARQAKLPLPEQGLKCPRCESINTKFCYFNNYSLSQPRHFCKTCRRYWTRGGALRNVPVGGGCRRNKRSSKSGGSKSSASNGPKVSASLTGTINSANRGGIDGGGAINSNITPPQLPFMAPSTMNTLADYGAAAAAAIGLNFNFSGIPTVDPVMEHQVGSSSTGVGLEQWRSQAQAQQFPLFTGLESTQATASTVGMYPVNGETMVGARVPLATDGQAAHGKAYAPSGLIPNPSGVKTEDNARNRSLPKQYLEIPGNEQYWGGTSTGGGTIGGSTAGGTGWTDMMSFTSSPTANFL